MAEKTGKFVADENTFLIDNSESDGVPIDFSPLADGEIGGEDDTDDDDDDEEDDDG